MKFYKKIIMSLTLLVVYQYSSAQDVFVSVSPLGVVVADWNEQECVTPKEGWDFRTYEVKYKESGTASWDEVFYSDESGVIIGDSTDFINGVTYKVKVRYNGLRNNCRGIFHHARELDTIEFTYSFTPPQDGNPDDKPVTYPQVVISDESTAIRNVLYGKCLYPYTWAGGSIDSVRLHNWNCSGSDAQAFILEDAGFDVASGNPLVRLRSQLMNLCVTPKNDADLGEVGVSNCSSAQSRYQIDMVSGDSFRLKNNVNNKCLFGGSANGDLVKQHGCFTLDVMRFTLEEY